MFNRIPMIIGALALALASVPATSAQAEVSKKRCAKVLFMNICAPSLTDKSDVVKLRRDRTIKSEIERDGDDGSRVASVPRGSKEPEVVVSQEDRRAQAAADERARAEDAARRAKDAEERARAAEDRAATYKEKYERRRDRAKEVPSDHNLAAEAEWAEKYGQVQATADKARAKADLKAEIADRAAEQVDKDTGGQEPEEPQEEMPDYDEAV